MGFNAVKLLEDPSTTALLAGEYCFNFWMAPTYSSLYSINTWHICEGKQNVNNTLRCPFGNELRELLLSENCRKMIGL